MQPPHAGIGAGAGAASAARRQLFDKIGGAPEGTAITVKAQFLEIYNEELRDLLGGLDQQGSATDQQQLSSSSPQHSPGPACSGSPSQQRSIVIRECPDGQITVNGENLLLHEYAVPDMQPAQGGMLGCHECVGSSKELCLGCKHLG